MNHTITDLSMMKSTDKWPCWPILPVKHITRKEDGNFPLVGFLFDSDSTKYVVFIGNMYDIKNIGSMPRESFDSYEGVIAAGWIVG